MAGVNEQSWRWQNCHDLTTHEVKKLPKTTTFTCTGCGFRVEHTHAKVVKP